METCSVFILNVTSLETGLDPARDVAQGQKGSSPAIDLMSLLVWFKDFIFFDLCPLQIQSNLLFE